MSGLLKQKPGKRSKPRAPVKVVQKSGSFKRKAAASYGTYGNLGSGTHQLAHKESSVSVVDASAADCQKAFEELQRDGFIRGHSRVLLAKVV